MNAPYYIVPYIERYQELEPDSEEAKKLSRLIAANIGDYAALRLILGIDPPEFARFYPDMEASTPSTIDTIDSFLDKYGANSPSEGFFANDKPGEPELDALIKEHKYQEALELIQLQNLNNPNKSIYFAHQMRFLKKLIAIDNFRNKQRADL